MSAEHSAPAHPALDAHYEILRELGRGGTALVYLARERATGAEVAIKLIRSKYVDDDEALARFAREARFVEQLRHPNIVPVRAVLDLGDAGIAIVMARLAGRTLRQVIQQDGRLSPDAAERVVRDIARALDAAHALGAVHRDVKPENIFINDPWRAVLTDFGLARSMGTDTQLTMHGVAIGTPAYMAPEQIDGGSLDARTDVYSLGLVAWEMLAGHRPWEGETLYAILYHQKHDALPDVRDLRDDVPDRLADVIAQSIEKEPEARWRNMRELVGALDNPKPSRTPRQRTPQPTETIRFTRPPTPSTSAAVAGSELEPSSHRRGESPALALPARARRSGKRAVLLGVTLAFAAFATIAVREYSAQHPRAPSDRGGEITLSGDSRAPVMLQAPRSDLASSQTPPVVAPEPAPATASRPTSPVSRDSASTPVSKSLSVQRSPPALPPTIAPVTIPSVSTGAAPAVSASRSTIVAGGMHSCFINADGRVLCWGNNDQNQLGTNTAERTVTPSAIRANAQFTTLAAGLSHSCGIARDGAAWCWGSNDHGQLGDRTPGTRLAPVRVADAHVFRALSAGEAHTCGLDAYGLAWCWGANARGQLGDDSSRDSALPMAVVTGGTRYAAIATGWNFACALATEGRAYCWGDNTAGQLGDGSTTDRRTPVPVASPLRFTSIAAGNSHACGITAEGAAYCWGRNANGQLGDGTATDRTTPVRVRSSVRLASITTGAVHTCAVADDGLASCWGRNTYGQLGTGRTGDEPQPAPVADHHAFTSLRAFGSHTCGVTTAGEPFCWGYNLEHQLGDGTRTHRNRPVRAETSSWRE